METSHGWAIDPHMRVAPGAKACAAAHVFVAGVEAAEKGGAGVNDDQLAVVAEVDLEAASELAISNEGFDLDPLCTKVGRPVGRERLGADLVVEHAAFHSSLGGSSESKATSTAAALNQPTEKTVDNLSERTDPLTPPEPPRDEKSAISPDSIPRKLAEILPNLPTFRMVEEFPLSASSSKPLTTVAHSSPAHLPDDTQEAIQSLFLTEDPIDLPKVAALCGSLPGIESCVLAHQYRVLCSHNAPDGMDLVSLSSNASTMLRSMQNASDKMGIGDIPAVTLHTPRGPLSILQQERLTLIVLHGKRGFIPGVREKMTATLLELNRSQLQLPASSESSSQPHAQP